MGNTIATLHFKFAMGVTKAEGEKLEETGTIPEKLFDMLTEIQTKMEKQDRRLTESMRGSSGCAQHTAKYMS